MKLNILPDPSSLVGFGQNVRRVVVEKSGETLAFVADVAPGTRAKAEDDETGPEIWVHFPRPLSKKKAKAVMDELELRR